MLHDNIYFETHLTESDAAKDMKLLELLHGPAGRTVVYCATGNATEYVHQLLRDHRIDARCHHPRLRKSERQKSIHNFMLNRRSVMIVSGPLPREILATEIRLMIHFNFPASLRDYIQETSALGVDGQPARSVLLYLRRDKRTQKRDLNEERQVTVYAQSAICRSKLLARYHGGAEGEDCQRCDNCLKTPKSRSLEEKKRIDLDELFPSFAGQ